MTGPADDIDRIMAVMTAAFDPAYGEAWTRRQVEDALLIGRCYYTIADVMGAPAGFTLSRHGFEEEELLLIAVAPEFRGRGSRGTVASGLQGCRPHPGRQAVAAGNAQSKSGRKDLSQEWFHRNWIS